MKLVFLFATSSASAFSVGPRVPARPAVSEPARPAMAETPTTCDFSTLPGDPSLILNVNVALKDKKAFMKAASQAIVSALSKPEQYVAVCVNDGLDIIWAGEDTPCALGCLYSIGSISQETNGALTASICQLLETHGGVPSDRVYINFFDIPRANCGWSGRTFAG